LLLILNMKMLRRYRLDEISPWDIDDPNMLLSAFPEADRKPPLLLSRKMTHLPLPDLRRRTSSHCNNARTIQREAGKSMREINIEFPPPAHCTLNRHEHPLQEITLRNEAAPR
jgi:hypothetical protein